MREFPNPTPTRIQKVFFTGDMPMPRIRGQITNPVITSLALAPVTGGERAVSEESCVRGKGGN